MAEGAGWTRWVGHGAAALGALGLAPAGVAKLLGVEQLAQNFARWGFPGWFLPFTGALEVAASLLLLVPRTRWVGGGLGAAVMAGAIGTHLRAGEAGEVVAPLVIGACCAAAGWLGRPRRG